MPLLSWSNACLAILYESCYHPVFCASIDGRSSRFITSINPRNATSLHPSPLNLMIAFSTLSKYLILWPKGPLRRRLSEMYWAQGTPIDVNLSGVPRGSRPLAGYKGCPQTPAGRTLHPLGKGVALKLTPMG